jgi:magnesium chelatase family protein
VLAKVTSGAVIGLDAVRVTVEVDIAAQGLPSFTIVGLPDKAVEESKERVRAALKNSGAEFPAKRITVNLAPADLPKAGPSYDLPIAYGILVASGQLPEDKHNGLFIGELSLDGSLQHTNGILPLATMLAKRNDGAHLYIPAPDAAEAAIIGGITVYPVTSLIELFHHFSGGATIVPQAYTSFSSFEQQTVCEFDLSDIAGQEQAKRVLEIAAAGGHNLFMQGPPGAGKTMLARTIPSILPRLTEEEALEVTNIYSITGNLPPGQSVVTLRPFRAPHHTTSRIGLVGGGVHPIPGEISLAHRGVLFLDEFPEFPRSVLEALRQPVEDGFVSISRAAGSFRYPANFMLVAAANPCPCGNFGSLTHACKCPPALIARYRRRVSGPLMDRIDLHLSVPPVRVEKFEGAMPSETSAVVRTRVQEARDRQLLRYKGSGYTANADLSTKAVRTHCPLSPEVKRFLGRAVSSLGLSARSYFKVIRVSRTIADLAADEEIECRHVAEALQYRPSDDAST